jgi:exodeoxyribonuclease VII small subunit
MPGNDESTDAGGPPVGDLSYTEASRELDDIVRFFERREVDVDQLVGRLERATAIVDELDRRLRRTRAQVEELVPRLAAVLSAEPDDAEPDDDEPNDDEPNDDEPDDEAMEAELEEADELIELIEEVVEETIVVAEATGPRSPEAQGLF